MVTNKPTVEIIIPTYNRASLLKETLQSLLSQSYSSLKIIVVDDGSTDDTYEMLRELKTNEPRLTILRNIVNMGESASVMRGWKSCSGNWIGIVNSDDPQDQFWLEGMMSAIIQNPGFILYYPDRRILNSAGEIVRYEPTLDWDRRKIYQNLICITSAGTIINKTLLPHEVKIRPRDSDFPSDLLQLLEIAKYGEGYRVANVFGTWREHPENLSNLPSGKSLSERFHLSVTSWFNDNKDFEMSPELKVYLYGHMWVIARRTESWAKTLKYLISKGLILECRDFMFLGQVLFLLFKRFKILTKKMVRLR